MKDQIPTLRIFPKIIIERRPTAKYLENPRYIKAYFLRICVIFSEFRGKSNL
jgi:hypothetical protein